MSFKEILDLNADTTRKLDKEGDKQAGYYLGFRTNETAFGVSRLHVFKSDTGNVGLWGSAMLDEKLSRIQPGTMVQVSYQGKEVLKGGRTLKKFKVLEDNENTIDVATVANESSNDSADASDFSADIDSDEALAEDEIIGEAPRATLTKGTAKAAFGKAHGAQVNNLLNKK